MSAGATRPGALRAEIHGPRDVRFTLVGADRPVDAAAYRLADGRGEPIPVADVLPWTEDGALLVPGRALDPTRVHHLEIPELELRALVRRDPWFRSLYSTAELGARVAEDGSRTTFRVFSPRARRVRLFLYDEPDAAPGEARAVVEMERDPDGVWAAERPGSLHGTWYDFTVHGPPDPGNRFFETHPVHVSDPYALVNDGPLGKSRVWKDGPPPPPLEGGRPAMEDVVAYEVHVQDFTDLLPVPHPGTFEAFATPGLVNAAGEPVGLDHLVELGVNVVHLMPLQQYMRHPDEAWRRALAGDPWAEEMGIAEENYQWGYRTTHAFAVESRYRTPGTEPGAERDQLRSLVAALHERGMAVVVDVVPNHTGEDMDGRHDLIHLGVLDRPYWYRTDQELDLIGPFGNEIKTEERPMVQRWLLDQLLHWVEALGVDGFRVDLAGQIDKQTLRWLRARLPDDVLLYGEPWIPPSDPAVAAHPDWGWYKLDAPISFFQDAFRNAVAGSPFDVEDRGWAGGDDRKAPAVRRALADDWPEEPETTRGVNYLDIHDNWALADRYALEDQDGRKGVDVEAVRTAAGLLLTSPGPVVIHGGTEILRSKGLAPLGSREVEVDGATVVFHGRWDTYNLRAPNRFLWDELVPGSDALAMRDFWRELISLRLSEAGEVFRVRRVPDGWYAFGEEDEPGELGYVVGGRVAVRARPFRAEVLGALDDAEPAGVGG